RARACLSLMSSHCFFSVLVPYLHALALPTRRSSDLVVVINGNLTVLPGGRVAGNAVVTGGSATVEAGGVAGVVRVFREPLRYRQDRKSTRLNSSHVKTSYAVFCLKKLNHQAPPTAQL